MNSYEIERVAANDHACPNVRKGVKLLHSLLHSVNQQSDGWHSWPAPSRSAKKLIELLQTAGNLNYDTHGTITAAQLTKAVAPIKRMVTVQKEKQKQYGNTFNFDVTAALNS